MKNSSSTPTRSMLLLLFVTSLMFRQSAHLPLCLKFKPLKMQNKLYFYRRPGTLAIAHFLFWYWLWCLDFSLTPPFSSPAHAIRSC
ncbi:hypothetical protein V1527DRAFT_478362 [Lipomyces starkeyi]